jgi:lipoprotein-anchoring transpeptidase ErfK/SrfK
MASINRRTFLKLTGSAIAAATATPLLNATRVFAEQVDPLTPPEPLGRVLVSGLPIRTSPTATATIARVLNRDDIIPLYEQLEGQAFYSHNNMWYRTDGGYVYSPSIQPIEDVKNTPEPDKASAWFWGDVTVAYTTARVAPDPDAQSVARLYYTGVFRVIDAMVGTDGEWWYRLQEGITYSPGPYIHATDLRRFDPSELTPLSPDVSDTDKIIRVNLAAQTLEAYENGVLVLKSRVSSGYGDFGTPVGNHTVLFKYPTAHMIGGQGADYYDLPGVAFPTFLTWSGVAVHAAYWHNDFGHARSHGCLNVPASVARWVWRWTTPAAPYDAATYTTPDGVTGTRIIVA